MRATSLMVLDAWNSSGEEDAAREAAVRHDCKWKKRLERGGPGEEWREKGSVG